MTEEWKKLVGDQKTPYENMQANEKERYVREMRDYKKKIESSKDGAP